MLHHILYVTTGIFSRRNTPRDATRAGERCPPARSHYAATF
jgi:hypothetical protein